MEERDNLKVLKVVKRKEIHLELVQLSTNQAAWGASSVIEKIAQGTKPHQMLVSEKHFHAKKLPLKYLLVKGSI